AFGYVGLDWKDYVAIDERLYRPAEVYELRGDFSKARKNLGWEPTISSRELIRMMVDVEMGQLKRQSLKFDGYPVDTKLSGETEVRIERLAP
ncbi:MAG: GDP-mannose 4,6-dehydratase, partial [Nitrososphaera sp.]